MSKVYDWWVTDEKLKRDVRMRLIGNVFEKLEQTIGNPKRQTNTQT